TAHAFYAGSPVSSNEDRATVLAQKNPALAVDKSVSPATFDQAGQTLTYTYTVTNTGNVTMTAPVTIADDRATVTCPPTLLAPGQTLTCTATYTVTQADLGAGSVINTASATSGTTTSPADSAS